MGTQFSYSRLNEENKSHVPSFNAIGLSESDVGEIHAIYKKWIDSETGILSLNNMMQKLHSKTTPFTRKIFDLHHADAVNDCVPFYKFVLGLWNYCTLDDANLVNYVFELYDGECDQINDDGGEGVLDVPTCKMVIKELYGDESEKKLSPGAKECIEKLRELKSSKAFIDLAFLSRFSRKCPDFLKPAIILRTLFIESTNGPQFWQEKARARKGANNGSYVSKDLLIKRAMRRNMNAASQSSKHRKQEMSNGANRNRNISRGVKQVFFKEKSSKTSSYSEKYPEANARRKYSEGTISTGSGASSFSEEKGTFLDQFFISVGLRSANPPETKRCKKAKKQKPIVIKKVSSRTISSGGSKEFKAPGVCKDVGPRKLHKYEFYSNGSDGWN